MWPHFAHSVHVRHSSGQKNAHRIWCVRVFGVALSTDFSDKHNRHSYGTRGREIHYKTLPIPIKSNVISRPLNTGLGIIRNEYMKSIEYCTASRMSAFKLRILHCWRSDREKNTRIHLNTNDFSKRCCLHAKRTLFIHFRSQFMNLTTQLDLVRYYYRNCTTPTFSRIIYYYYSMAVVGTSARNGYLTCN